MASESGVGRESAEAPSAASSCRRQERGTCATPRCCRHCMSAWVPRSPALASSSPCLGAASLVFRPTRRLVSLEGEGGRQSGQEEAAMLVATFGPTTEWAGKAITYDAGAFLLENTASCPPTTSLSTTLRGTSSGRATARAWVGGLAVSTPRPAQPVQSAPTEEPSVHAALVRCPTCDHEVSSQAPSCPSCGHPFAAPAEPERRVAGSGWGDPGRRLAARHRQLPPLGDGDAAYWHAQPQWHAAGAEPPLLSRWSGRLAAGHRHLRHRPQRRPALPDAELAAAIVDCHRPGRCVRRHSDNSGH